MITLPPVIGHRGAAAVAPGNSLASFEAAARAGARWVEFDVRLSADGVALVIHDPALGDAAPGAGGEGLVIAETAAEEIRAASGAPPVPTLPEVLLCLRDHAMGANVEIKPQQRRREVAAAVLSALAACPLPAGALISSFDVGILAALRRQDRKAALGLLLKRPLPAASAVAGTLGCVSIHCEHSSLGRRQLERWRAAGLMTLAYTVNNPARASRLLSWGLDAVICDDPRVMLGRLPS